MYYHGHSLMASSSKFKPTPAQYLLNDYLQRRRKSYFYDIQNKRVSLSGAPNDIGQI